MAFLLVFFFPPLSPVSHALISGLATSRNWQCSAWLLWEIGVTAVLDNTNFGLSRHPEQFEACLFHNFRYLH